MIKVYIITGLIDSDKFMSYDSSGKKFIDHQKFIELSTVSFEINEFQELWNKSDLEYNPVNDYILISSHVARKKKYSIRIIETLSMVVDVENPDLNLTLEDAINLVEEKYKKSVFVLGSEDFVSYKIIEDETK